MVLLQHGYGKKKSIRITGRRSEVLKEARGRMLLVMACLGVAYILLLARVTDLALLQGTLQRYADNNMIEQVEDVSPAEDAPARRTDIVDRNGVLLATTLETSSLYADPVLLPDVKEVARDLVEALPDLRYGDVLQRLQRKGRFVWIKRNLTPDEQYEVLKLGYPGLKFRAEPRRIYPHGGLFAHIVGYTSVDNEGLAGLERSFDGLLSYGEGNRLVTSLDVRVQHILRSELQEAVTRFSGVGAAGLVMDVTNGEILAAVSLPDFDPHDPGDATLSAYMNRISLGVYEMGSVMKVFSTAAFIESQNTGMGYEFDARKPLKRSRFTIRDYHPEERIMTLPEVFAHSSNIGSALMAEKMGTEVLKKFYADFGFLDAPDIEIGEIGNPQVPSPWREIDTVTTSYGHSLAVSALQISAAAATVVNGGLRIRPTLIREKTGLAMEMPSKNTEIRVLSPQTAHRMRQLLRLAVTDGTGGGADVPGYRVGGKTGTAEKSAVKGKGYDDKRIISSFVAAFPMDEPRYVVFVMVDEPKGTAESFGYATGGWVAAPAAGQIIARMAPLLGIEPEHEGEKADIAVSLKRYIRDKDAVTARRQNASQ